MIYIKKILKDISNKKLNKMLKKYILNLKDNFYEKLQILIVKSL